MQTCELGIEKKPRSLTFALHSVICNFQTAKTCTTEHIVCFVRISFRI